MLLFPTIKASKNSLPRGTNCGPEELLKTSQKRMSMKKATRAPRGQRPRKEDLMTQRLSKYLWVKPPKSDVVMPLEESELVPVFELLQGHPESVKTRKPYQKKAAVPKE